TPLFCEMKFPNPFTPIWLLLAPTRKMPVLLAAMLLLTTAFPDEPLNRTTPDPVLSEMSLAEWRVVVPIWLPLAEAIRIPPSPWAALLGVATPLERMALPWMTLFEAPLNR